MTERDAELDENEPKIKGRVVTTIAKAKEVRPLVEKCVTIARRSLAAQAEAAKFDTDAERNTDQWKTWRQSDEWRSWNAAIAPVVAARRRAVQLLGDKQAVQILFDEIAPRFEDRNGGYTRILRLATPRLGDAGTRAILEFVGVRDRVSKPKKSEKPAFEASESDESEAPVEEETAVTEDEVSDAESPAADSSESEASKEKSE